MNMKTLSKFPNLYISDHPLVAHKLTLMRQSSCPKVLFKMLLKEIGMLMGYELTSNLSLKEEVINTPVSEMSAPLIEGKKPVIIPILRAGLGMVEGLEDIMPAARVGHIGLYRDEETKQAHEYLVKLPKMNGRKVYLVDPMLATGGSAKHALDVLVANGVKASDIRFMVLVAAPEGVKVLLEAYPEVKIYTCALDDHLNENAYIVPGLGDAGDRLFGTLDNE